MAIQFISIFPLHKIRNEQVIIVFSFEFVVIIQSKHCLLKKKMLTDLIITYYFSQQYLFISTSVAIYCIAILGKPIANLSTD